MRIVVQDYAGHPFQVQLSRELARRGHRVLHLYAGYNQTPHGSLQKRKDDPQGFDVRGVYIRKPLQKYSFVKRWFQEHEYGALMTKEVLSFKPDAVVSANTPLDAQSILLKACRKNNIYFVNWLQDIISVAAKLLLGKKNPLVGNWISAYYINLERFILRQSDHIVLIASEYEPFLLDWGIPGRRMSVIPNWAPLEEIPALPKDNPWSREKGLADKFCFLYSGTLGMKHNPDLLLQLALRFKDNPEVSVLVGSEGPGADWLASKKRELGLDHLILMGYQPMEAFPQVLAAGDVLLAILEPEAGVFSVPSKILSYLCAERPLLLALPLENLAAKITREHRAGLVVAPNDSDGMLEKARELYTNPALRYELAQNARSYAAENFNIGHIATQFEEVLSEGVNGGNAV